MTSRIVLRPEAEREVSQAYDWYRRIHPDVARRFIEALDSALLRIDENPRRFEVAFGFRRAVLTSFPYCIYFVERPPNILVVAVFHGRRDPQRLRSR